MNLKLFPQAIILVLVPAIFQLIFVFTLAGLLRQAEDETAKETRSREVVAGADHVTKLFQQCGYCLYAYKNSKDQESRDQFREYCREVAQEIDHLRPLVAKRADENAALDRVSVEFQKAKDFGELVVRGMDHGVDYDAMKSALENRNTLLSMSNNMLRALRQLTEMERDSAKQVKSQGPETRKLIWNCLIFGVVMNIFLALFLARLFYRATSSRLNILVDNTKRLTTGEPLKPALTGRDEIAELDRVFHVMATALVESARKERAVIDYASDAICSINSDLQFLSANPASREIFGLAPEQLVGKNLVSVVTKDDWMATAASLKSSRENSKPVPFDSRVVRADGVLVDVRWSVHWSDSEERFFCVAHDISERKRVEIMKQDFVSMVSHDLRTPLMSIQADIELLSAESAELVASSASSKSGESAESAESGGKTAASRATAEPIELESQAARGAKLSSATRNIRYVITLINSLLDMERMSADKLEVELALTRLQNVFDKALDAVLPLAQKKQITLACSPTEIIVMADEARLAQVLINLISNALKFSERSTSIEIKVKEVVDVVEIRVIDQGRGIPREKLSSIFGRFEQVEKADTKIQDGAGLGLAICKKIIEEHHGTIGVDSQEGKGSEFWIKLPA